MKIDAKLLLRPREQRAWSQKMLATAAGLNLRTVQRIEKSASASGQSVRALAGALDVDVQEMMGLQHELSPCPECGMDSVYEYDRLIESSTISGELLPKLASGMFSSARMRAVVCADCGFLRYFVDAQALEKMRSSRHWKQV